MSKKSSGLWKNSNFRNLWSGMTVSFVGSQVTTIALPTIALLVLNASAVEVGILKSLEVLMMPLLGLFAGVLADRLNPRKIMITSDISRFLVIMLIPLAYALDFLNMYVLFAAAALLGAFTVFFNISYHSYIPNVVPGEHLVEGNSKLNLSQSMSGVVGPSFAGWLIFLVGAVWAVIVDSISYLFSAIFLMQIKPIKEREYKEKAATSIWTDIKEGFRYVWSNKTLKTLVFIISFCNMGFFTLQTMILVFAYQQLGMSSGLVGTILGIGSLGFVAGATFVSKLNAKLGVGRTMVLGLFTTGIAGMLLSLASKGYPAIVMTICWFLVCFALTVFDINQFTMRQLTTPMKLQGRMHATVRIVAMGVIPIAMITGGYLSEHYTAVYALIMAGASFLIAATITAFSHISRLKTHPPKVEDQAQSA
jgi:MFS family permease